MKPSRQTLPVPYTVANAVGRLLVKLPSMRLDEQSVVTSAMEQTGLADFGDPHYREGLLRLLESLNDDAKLHPIGRFITNDIVTNFLVQRLRLMEVRTRTPETFAPLIPPLIITGMARSGTTFLHRMLALDPAHRAIPQWMLMRPFPPRDWNGEGADPRIAALERGMRIRQPMLSGLDSIHYNRADTPEECILPLGLTFNSLIFGTILPVRGYMDWYMEHMDSLQKYREYRWVLQAYQSHEPDRRLTMKAPAHGASLNALFSAIPEAMVIQTHRDPVACLCSVCSLVYTFHLAMTNDLNVQGMAEAALQLYEVWARNNIAFRDAHPGLVHDVMYDTLVSDPFGTVRDIYARFELPWTDAHASQLRAFIASNPKNKHGAHRYAAADFGLDEDEIAERLSPYSEYFGV